MNVADLFVNLSVKGADKAKKDLGGVDKGMKGIASSSLQAKAMILAAFYAAERLVSGTAALGTNLLNFSKITNLNVRDVQKWQWAAKQAGGTADDMANSIKGVQDAIAKMRRGEGGPAGLGAVAASVGLDDASLDDPFYVLKKIQEYVRKNPGIQATAAARTFQVSDQSIGALRDNRFKPDSAVGILSEGQLKRLDMLDRKIEAVYEKVQKYIAKILTSSEGTKFLDTLSNIITSVLKLSEDLIKLADNLKVFYAVGKILDTINASVNGIRGAATGGASGSKTLDNVVGPNKPLLERLGNVLVGSGTMDFLKNPTMDSWLNKKPDDAGRTPQSVTVNQEFDFSGACGLDANDVGRAARNQVCEAFRQMQSQTQGN